MYVPTLFFTVLFVATPVSAGTVIMNHLKKRKRSIIGVSVASLVILPVVFVLVSYTFGILGFRQLSAWSLASNVGHEYLTAARDSAFGLPEGSTVFLINLPHGIECSQISCLGNATMFEDYSVDAWMKLSAPGRDIKFVAVSTI